MAGFHSLRSVTLNEANTNTLAVSPTHLHRLRRGRGHKAAAMTTGARRHFAEVKSLVNEIEMPGGVAPVTQQLMEARRKDPKAQWFPEINVDIIGADRLRAGERKTAIEIFKLNLLAYPDSADAHDNLADAYWSLGQKKLARQHAEKALAMIDAHTMPFVIMVRYRAAAG